MWKVDIRANVPVLGMVGSDAPLDLDGAAMTRRMQAMEGPPNGQRKYLRKPEDLLDLYIGDWRQRRPDWLNTDEHPRVEFFAPITQRARGLLREARLKRFYKSVFMQLPAKGIRYTPPPGGVPVDLLAGRRKQLSRLGD